MDFAWLMGRVQRLLMSPASEWDAIAGEAADVQKIYMTYVGPLVIASAVASFIGLTLVGVAGFRYPMGSGFTFLILQIVLGLGTVYVVGLVINALAPQFGATPDSGQAFKLAAYSPTAYWVASLITIIPMLGILALLGGLYSLYLLYLGLPKLMKPAADKTVIYVVAVVGVMIVINIVVGAVAMSVMPAVTPMMSRY